MSLRSIELGFYSLDFYPANISSTHLFGHLCAGSSIRSITVASSVGGPAAMNPLLSEATTSCQHPFRMVAVPGEAFSRSAPAFAHAVGDDMEIIIYSHIIKTIFCYGGYRGRIAH